MKKIGILYHPMVEATQRKARAVQEFLESRGVAVWQCSSWETGEARKLLAGTDLLLAVGGDGTILRAAQAVVPGTIPVTGINMGKLGFLTELSAAEALEKLPLLLSGKGWLDERAMLQAEFGTGKKAQVFHALNDIVVARGAVARVIYVETCVNRETLSTYKADAVVAATATGSTGYVLASGGPVIYPRSPDFLIMPVAPHTGLRHAVVLPQSAVVSMRVSTLHPATLSVDGQVNLPLANDDVITVRRSPHTVRFLRLNPETEYYRSLKERLTGKQV
ncbi:MAG: NAD(+)/NADH kinase [Dehalococcoidales bacterium]|nr:NAD(+)/NADH kinase [Dehalococcoidales bacterium]